MLFTNFVLINTILILKNILLCRCMSYSVSMPDFCNFIRLCSESVSKFQLISHQANEKEARMYPKIKEI